jgi:hypothetical protein
VARSGGWLVGVAVTLVLLLTALVISASRQKHLGMADISRFGEQAKKKRSAFADFLAGDQGSDNDFKVGLTMNP